MIVTMGLDNMDNNFNLSSKRIKIVKTSKFSIRTVITKQQSIYIFYCEFDLYFLVINIIF